MGIKAKQNGLSWEASEANDNVTMMTQMFFGPFGDQDLERQTAPRQLSGS